jgi:glycerol uptake facilitator-like aquaporin
MADDDPIAVSNNLPNNTETKIAPIQIGLTLLHQNVSPFQGFLVEALITFILILTVFSCIDKHRKDLHGSFPHSIGFAITVGALFGVNSHFILLVYDRKIRKFIL